jgi:hypothetical protein
MCPTPAILRSWQQLSKPSGIEYISGLRPDTEAGPFYTDLQPGDIVRYNPLDSITVTYDHASSVFTLTTKMGETGSDVSVSTTPAT